MGDIFGGKLTAGIFGIVGLFVGVIMIGIMAGPFGSLVAYFDRRCGVLHRQQQGEQVPTGVHGSQRGHRSHCRSDQHRHEPGRWIRLFAV